jgi:hypothetical protein
MAGLHLEPALRLGFDAPAGDWAQADFSISLQPMNERSPSQDDFEAAFDAAFPRLQATAVAACPPDGEWPARVAAAIYAVLDFAAADPAAMRVLTIDALSYRPDGGRRYRELIDRFAELLRAEAPREEPLPTTTEHALIGGIAVTIVEQIRAGMVHRLPESAPELIEFSLLPYLGSVEARRWSRRTAP